MRMSVMAVLTGAALGVTGCAGMSATTQPTPSVLPTPTATATASASASAAANPVASCLVGSWQTTSVAGFTGLSGGSGATMTIGADGSTTINFAGMQPIAFAVTAAQINLKGSFVYGGQATGKISTDSAAAASGKWQPVGPIDWSKVTATLQLTDPVATKPLDNTPLRDVVGDKADPNKTGGVVDVAPMLGQGNYTCEGNTTVTLEPLNGKGLKWTFTKK